MSISVDISWSSDWSVDSQGRTVIANAEDTYIQRLIRRILTTPRILDSFTNYPIVPPDYIFHPSFGAGLRRLIGYPVRPDALVRLIEDQVVADPETSTDVKPEIRVDLKPNGVALIAVKCVREPNVTVAFGFTFGK